MTQLPNRYWSYDRSWSGATENIHAAREFVVARLVEHGLDSVSADVLLVVSELVTNVVKHAPGPVDVALVREGDRVEVRVGDCSATPPVQRSLDLSALGGRGLLIVAACSIAWGVRPTVAGGKSVWAAFDVTPIAPGPGTG